ncbi:MAG: hypothetical protein ACFCD0_13100 [Gemmataceae bacterium]
MMRSLFIASIFSLGALALGTSAANAQNFHGPSRGQSFRPPVSRFCPWQCRHFHCYREACSFRHRMRCRGYETCLRRVGRCWHVKYRRCCGGYRPYPRPRPIIDPRNNFGPGRGQPIHRVGNGPRGGFRR